ncbi:MULTISPECIES: bifunctional diguanylate cyclase/phosphodiesterase [Pantoea]|uniref:bifunctional diguanylate cyclase/phosphodiesterase n=1 Tax=Pantoea TaxID=53335 RepID=UPI001F0B50A7|nr:MULTISPECIES: EAL domain-containing protein [Pantoea]
MRGLIRQPMMMMVLLILLAFTGAFISLMFIASDLNQQSDRQQSLLLDKALQTRQAVMQFHLSDNAGWGEAYQNLHRTLNRRWAWDNQNLGASLFDTFAYEGVFVISPQDETRYSVIRGRPEARSLALWLGTDPLRRIKAQLQASAGNAISDYVLADAQLTLYSAAWITPGGDRSVTTLPGPPSLMVFTDRLTPQKLLKLGQEYGIHNLHLDASPAARPASPHLLIAVGDKQVALIWRSANPGGALLTGLLPLLVLIMLLSLFTALMLMRSALRKAQLNDESTWLLGQSQLALSASERRFRDIAETTTDWIWEMDSQLRLVWISGRFPVVTGFSSQEWIQRTLADFLLDYEKYRSRLMLFQQSGGQLTLTGCRYRSAQGHMRYCNLTLKEVMLTQGVSGFRGSATDITLEYEAQARAHYLSHFDELTGLANRVQMQEFLTGKLSLPSDPQHRLAIIMIDLDKFKPVNDIYGHTAGDKVLHEVSGRIRACLGSHGLVARLGGDEFVAILPEMNSRDRIVALCQQLIARINDAFEVCDNTLHIGASLGIALAPQDADNASDLLRYADIALYKAKNSGRNQWVFFDRDMEEKIVQRRELEHELRDAINSEQLALVYQARYALAAGEVTAVEALVRWQHPRLGLLMPDQFIPLAEETGLISALSDWVLLRACSDIVQFEPALSVSVNISATELQNDALPSRIAQVLQLSGLPNHRLEIEVTENALLSDPEKTLATMQAVKALGVKFLIDDFGTGYASLCYLRAFPFDGLKIDKSFIFPLGESPQARQVVENMIGLGRAYSLSVTAEGVETPGHMAQLQALACDAVQGYYIGRPGPLAQIVMTVPDDNPMRKNAAVPRQRHS